MATWILKPLHTSGGKMSILGSRHEFEDWESLSTTPSDLILFRPEAKIKRMSGGPEMKTVPLAFTRRGERFGVALIYARVNDVKDWALTLKFDEGASDYLASYRAMKVLDRLPVMDSDLIEPALVFVGGKVESLGRLVGSHAYNDATAAQRLRLALGGADRMLDFRQEIMQLEPTAEEISRMNRVLQKNGVSLPSGIVPKT